MAIAKAKGARLQMYANAGGIIKKYVPRGKVAMDWGIATARRIIPSFALRQSCPLCRHAPEGG